MNNLYDKLAGLSPQQRALFEQRLAEKGIASGRGDDAIKPRAAGTAAPLSFAQQRLWFVQQFDPQSAAYNAGSALRLRGPLDPAALHRAINRIVRRHESLRTAFLRGPDGKPMLRIAEPSDLALPLTELNIPTDAAAAIHDAVSKVLEEPFDLQQPPLRCALLRTGELDHVLVVVTHHIVSDRWSVMVFLRELTALYRAELARLKTELPALPIQYADWALWQQQRLSGDRLQTLLAYWQDRLRGPLPYLELPADHALPAVASSNGAQRAVRIDSKLATQLKGLAGRHKVTLFSLLLAAFKTLLLRYGGSSDIIVGSEVANRDRSETAGLIGPLVNTLVLRTDLSGDPGFDALLTRVHATVVDALKHQDLPFEKLVEVLNPERNLDQLTPLFQAKFDLQQISLKSMQFDDLKLEHYPVEQQQTKYQLRFNLQDSDAGIHGQIEYSTDLFEADTIDRMAGHFITLLRGILGNPKTLLSQLPLLTEPERRYLITQCHGNYVQQPDGLLHGQFEAQAALTPDAPAVSDTKQTLNYAQLDAAAARVAAGLMAQGVGLESAVGVCMQRSANMIVALLGILKAGGAYVPLDPDYPARRLGYIVDDARIDILIGDGSQPGFSTERDLTVLNVEDLAAGKATATVPTPKADGLAYVIYTSGSTGLPKGVAIEHRNAVAMLHWARAQFADEALAGVLAATSVCFDLSVFEVFVPLACGGRVIVADNLLALPRHPARDTVTLVNTVPSLLGQLLAAERLPANVKTVNLAGEPLPPVLVRQLQALPGVRHIYNLYGPSEDTTYSTCAALDSDHFGPDAERVPIGFPVDNTHALVLDAQQQPVPLGVAGELYLGGAGLARGYLYRDALTAEKFIANPLPDNMPHRPARLYRTGDKVVRRADGRLEFLGRFDHQFKIRGFRIEAGEVEAALREHPALSEALVVAQQDDKGVRQLLAYIVVDGDQPPATATLRAFLAERLPSPMVPTLWQVLEALPRLPNGKVDPRRLPQPHAATDEPDYAAPGTDTETLLADTWGALLGRERIGVNDDFFALGGHSLLAIEMITRVEQACGRSIPLRMLFQAPTVATLAAVIDGEHDGDLPALEARSAIEPDPDQAAEPFPLTDIQQAYWLGRSGAFELGNIATHGYREIDCDGLAPDAIASALNQLIRRHGMLRVVIDADGQQRILDEVPDYHIALTDLSKLDDQQRVASLAAIRERLSHQVFELATWPLFSVEAAQLGAGRLRYFVSFDVVIGDAWSLQLLGREMAQCLGNQPLAPLAIGFRDYVLAEKAFEKTAAYQRSLDYWQDRLETLPAAPELPLTCALSTIETPRFTRRSAQLDRAAWQRLRKRTRGAGISPSALVLTAFSEVLARWSRRRRFTLNLTLFNRHPRHADVSRLIGDFTSSLLLGFECNSAQTMLQRARSVQAELWEALEHRAVSGVRVLRDLARREGRAGGALMPVVFTSTLGQAMSSLRPGAWQAEVGYALSQTSQVYLDHQVSEIDGELHVNWDAIEALFPAGVLDDMFSAYTRLLEALANDDAAWQGLAPIDHGGYLTDLNSTWIAEPEASAALLHELFFHRAEAQPDALAVITTDRNFSYRELAQRVNALAAELVAANCEVNQLVAIALDKGWQQVVATLGVLAAGGAYVPIDPALPRARRQELVEDTGAAIVISQLEDWPEPLRRLTLPAGIDEHVTARMPAWHAGRSDLAYVIYTSGSTGMPKGVMIDHRGAVNTILDINRRIELGPSDRVFALSSLSFDLSVYDLFGTLAAGAAIVIPDADKHRDPAHWLALLTEQRVSVWNSVPALLQLLLNEIESGDAPATRLRTALLSGDWIPLTLPPQLQQLLPAVRLISMGGATEASIWSIWHEVATLAPDWNSVPYGRPLDNQSWYILDEQLQPCPPWVSGDLYIGGVGLARGYWQRPLLTANSFIPNPFGSSVNKPVPDPVLYRTGDIGRYRPDGLIEFLGREDAQVKINGHRIELGEIEHALQQHPSLAGAAVTTFGTPPELVAYVVPASSDDDRIANPLERLAFKGARHAGPAPVDGIALPAVADPGFRRQSHRRFLSDTLPLQRFAELLGTLAGRETAGGIAPKFRYPSAGSLYPVTVYLSVKPGRIENLDGGWYRYDALGHQLLPLARERADSAAFYTANAKVFADSAFTVFLVADLSAIEPVYGERSQDFCLLEAGYMGQLLMEQAPGLEIGLCPLNDPGFDALGDVLPLDEKRVLLHGLVGGAIDPTWSERWMSIDGIDSRSFIQVLQDHLRDHLPAYMVPARFQLIDELPLSANGKLDRKRLPEVDASDTVEYRAPGSETEKQVVELWQQVLKAERIGLDDNFFQLGGNSLLAIRLLTGLRTIGSPELSIAELFGALTPAEQAALVDSRRHEASTTTSIKRVARESSATADLSDDAVDAMLADMLNKNANEKPPS